MEEAAQYAGDMDGDESMDYEWVYSVIR
jgi:hypothetical protein